MIAKERDRVYSLSISTGTQGVVFMGVNGAFYNRRENMLL